ncbi:hypothetical protein GCM10009745_80350 [Kribbella yunnanensis]|uniref:PhoD-like phosphatase metallophosphatase domain-containing protein n=1 Tax=Kribbella yunnanensis TaxID=190194 RepID=A0ABP4VCK3_9ACTN
MLLAPAPVFGLRHIEAIQKFVINTGIQSAYDLDLESWSAEPQNIADLIRFLMQVTPDPCVILSGDVHYAATASLTVNLDPVGPTPRLPQLLRIAQFTSSASKNSSGPLRFLPEGSRFSRSAHRTYWWRDQPVPTVAHTPTPSKGKRAPDWSETYQVAGEKDIMLAENNIGMLVINSLTVDNHYRTAGGKEHFRTSWEPTVQSWPSG